MTLTSVAHYCSSSLVLSGYIAVFIIPSTWSFYLSSVLIGVGAASKCTKWSLCGGYEVAILSLKPLSNFIHVCSRMQIMDTALDLSVLRQNLDFLFLQQAQFVRFNRAYRDYHWDVMIHINTKYQIRP